METVWKETKVWEEEIVIPTYEVGEADKNPIFLEKRVYQGSTGKVYPYPIIEKISDKKVDKAYRAVYLENQYIKVMILPELGGRIQRAYDKTNDYDFVYYNHVIKPALVGLVGPWISGGIEFNWPQHHRPTTFMPVDYMLQENEDGSKTVLVNDVDRMYGTKGIAAFTLYPDKAYIEIKGQLYNRTAAPQTFLWWANPAVAVNENTQSIFPPDVHAVMDHGKRDVSKFPIATGVYYKKDYSEGVDISRYKNIPVPTSYMAEKSEFNFVGGYDYGVNAGILHVADHHFSPGKKQWTWGCGDFGRAWDRNLTDEDGPYIELMTGVYTDNQPDFTWLKPFEEKVFKQYFMPYKAVGQVKNASIDAAVNLELSKNHAHIIVYATALFAEASIVLLCKGSIIFEEKARLSPTEIYERDTELTFERETDITIKVLSCEGKELVSYTPLEKKVEKLPLPAQAAKQPGEIMTNEELYLTGMHIEQYRHATYEPDDYYLEGLKRDSGDIRINNAYGSLLMRRGLLNKAEVHFRKAIERLTWKNPNPYDSEAYYNLGLTLFCQEKEQEAFDAFYKAAWSAEQQEKSYYYLAAIDMKRGNVYQSLDFIERALVRNNRNVKARGLKAVLLNKMEHPGRMEWIMENIRVDGFDYLSRFELIKAAEESKKQEMAKELAQCMRNCDENYLQTARDYGEFGCYEDAYKVLALCNAKNPLLYYYQAYYLFKGKAEDQAHKTLEDIKKMSPGYCFPNKSEDCLVLNYAMESGKGGWMAPYLLGNFYYDKKQYERAVELWKASAEINEFFPTVLRNLALAYYNKKGRIQEAKELMERAFLLDTKDARVFLELDQLYKKTGISHEERLVQFDKYRETFLQRDDLYIEYITLLNLLGRHEEAYEWIQKRKFHPWEGGEGRITGQYTSALLELSKEKLKEKDYEAAKKLLTKALTFPDYLGEGKLEGSKDNPIHYYLGLVQECLGNKEEAKKSFERAALGEQEPAGMMYYNDQPADMILYQGLAKEKLGSKLEANSRFYKLIDYGEQHIFDEVKIDYFAVSLPDLSIFDEDFTKKNKAHCHFLIGLGNMGLGEKEKAAEAFERTLELDPNHLNAVLYRKMI